MKAVVAETPLDQTQATLTFEDGYPSLAPTPGNESLLVAYDRASQDVGAGRVTAVSPDRAGAADVSFVSGQVKNIIDGIGLMGTDDHSPSETADLSTLPSQTKRGSSTSPSASPICRTTMRAMTMIPGQPLPETARPHNRRT